ncbi:MAG TPA: O-antigen ligase family protein [Thermoleophilaceae bacterium]|nr:O-antigen ligase family protein [Thermoleophilaceae bacterium]
MSASRASAASTLLLALVVAGTAFGAAGGTELARTTVVELVLLLLAGGVLVAAVLFGPGGELHGLGTLLLFGLLAIVTALAITWSIAPELSYVEAGRTLTYLALFAAGLAVARLAPRAAPQLLRGLLLGGSVVVAYSLLSRVWPATIAEDELYNRIGQPFQYWNAVAATAAMCVPAALWLGARRTGSMLERTLAYPALGYAFLALLLTQSRGGLAAALVGAIAWFAIVPLRLRSLLVLLLTAAGAAAVGAWALSKKPFAEAFQPLASKEAVAGDFGLLLLLLGVVLVAAGVAVDVAHARGVVPGRHRRRIGIAALAVACAIPLVALMSVALSERGLGGTVEQRVDELTSETNTAPTQGAGRLSATESTRGKYWREADRVFDDRPLAGTGPGTFRIARLRHRTDDSASGHAHGFVPQTMADLGLVGLALTLMLLLAWLAAAARNTGLAARLLALRRERPAQRSEWDDQRIAFVALALVPVVFGVQSAIDWTWFVPGCALMALVAAGFVAGRGPLPAGLGAADGEAGPTADTLALSESAPVRARRLPRTAGAAPLVGRDRPRVLVAGGVALVTLLCAWAVWQPEASKRSADRALELIEERRFDDAVAEADDAADANPLSPTPLFVRASAEAEAGRTQAARRTLERATLRYPGEPQTWLRLSSFQLNNLERPQDALQTVRGALYLNPRSKSARELFVNARAALRAQQGGPPRAALGAQPG